ncbi:MAG: S41 family peptidase [Bacteroidales bacterium]
MIKRIKRLNLTYFLAIAFLCFLSNLGTAQEKNDNNFEIAKSLDIYSTIVKEVNTTYVDDVNQGELTKVSIDAMLKQLDPYTVYIPESQVEDYRFMTTGQYGGIGSIIQQRGDYVIIAEPYKGWPAQKAGLMAGDTIISIDGKDVTGKGNEKVSQMLKGEPGTTLSIQLNRYGAKEPLKKELTREKIQVDDIPYYGMLDDNVAYIKLTGFTQGVASELKEHFQELKKDNTVKGLVLDLRGNGGGLLSEAVDIVNAFVKRNEEVVTTRGRAEKEHVFKTRMNPLDTDIPLIVLINKGSASASEIVSGAIQDLDRGVIVGQRSFGKGLVQNVVPLEYNAKMKITIAKYYIPSGRCIQAIDYSHKDSKGHFENIPDSLIHEFKTKNGRPVFDGGGITPDFKTKPMNFEEISAYLYAKNFFFDFATMYRVKNAEIESPDKFRVSDAIYDEFLEFLKTREFDFKPHGLIVIDDLEKSAKFGGYLEKIEDQMQALKDSIVKSKEYSLEKFKPQIKELLRNEIVSRYYYQKGRVITALIDDPEITKSIEILNDQQLYNDILSGKYKQPEEKKDAKEGLDEKK